MEKEPTLTGFEDIAQAQIEGLLPTFSEVVELYPDACEEELGWYYESLVKEFRENNRREQSEGNTNM